jgi:hypothetical protein
MELQEVEAIVGARIDQAIRPELRPDAEVPVQTEALSQPPCREREILNERGRTHALSRALVPAPALTHRTSSRNSVERAPLANAGHSGLWGGVEREGPELEELRVTHTRNADSLRARLKRDRDQRACDSEYDARCGPGAPPADHGVRPHQCCPMPGARCPTGVTWHPPQSRPG